MDVAEQGTEGRPSYNMSQFSDLPVGASPRDGSGDRPIYTELKNMIPPPNPEGSGYAGDIVKHAYDVCVLVEEARQASGSTKDPVTELSPLRLDSFINPIDASSALPVNELLVDSATIIIPDEDPAPVTAVTAPPTAIPNKNNFISLNSNQTITMLPTTIYSDSKNALDGRAVMQHHLITSTPTSTSATPLLLNSMTCSTTTRYLQSAPTRVNRLPMKPPLQR